VSTVNSHSLPPTLPLLALALRSNILQPPLCAVLILYMVNLYKLTAEHADKLLAPITLGCKTKTGKIIGISIAALQRLVSLKGVPTVSVHGGSRGRLQWKPSSFCYSCCPPHYSADS